jgi:hypothetical protein
VVAERTSATRLAHAAEAPDVTDCRGISSSGHFPGQLAVVRVSPPPSGMGTTARHRRASPQGSELTARDITFSWLRCRVPGPSGCGARDPVSTLGQPLQELLSSLHSERNFVMSNKLSAGTDASNTRWSPKAPRHGAKVRKKHTESQVLCIFLEKLAGVGLLQRQRQHQRLHQPLRPLSHNANPRDRGRAHSSADLVH